MSRRANQRHRRKKRRLEAEERQEYYDGLTADVRVAQCSTRRGESKRELIRLLSTHQLQQEGIDGTA